MQTRPHTSVFQLKSTSRAVQRLLPFEPARTPRFKNCDGLTHSLASLQGASLPAATSAAVLPSAPAVSSTAVPSPPSQQSAQAEATVQQLRQEVQQLRAQQPAVPASAPADAGALQQAKAAEEAAVRRAAAAEEKVADLQRRLTQAAGAATSAGPALFALSYVLHSICQSASRSAAMSGTEHQRMTQPQLPLRGEQ